MPFTPSQVVPLRYTGMGMPKKPAIRNPIGCAKNLVIETSAQRDARLKAAEDKQAKKQTRAPRTPNSGPTTKEGS